MCVVLHRCFCCACVGDDGGDGGGGCVMLSCALGLMLCCVCGCDCLDGFDAFGVDERDGSTSTDGAKPLGDATRIVRVRELLLIPNNPIMLCGGALECVFQQPLTTMATTARARRAATQKAVGTRTHHNDDKYIPK